MMVANAGAKTLHNTKVAAAELFLKPELWSGRGLTANNIVEAFKVCCITLTIFCDLI
jgi:hypothetical protein